MIIHKQAQTMKILELKGKENSKQTKQMNI